MIIPYSFLSMKKELIHKYLPIFLIFFIVLFSMVPTFYEYAERWKIKPIRFFELVHNFPTDYNLYLSKIRQGKEGAWLATEKYTAEPHTGSLTQILYIIIGRVSDWSHVQTPYVWFSYHVMRVFFAVLLLWVIWKLCEWIFPSLPWRILTFLLVATASTWPKFESVDGWPRFGGYMPWYTMVDSLQRTTFMPHVLFGQAAMAFTLWVFAGGFITRKHPGNWIFLGIIGIAMGIVFPPALLFIYVVLGFYTLYQLVPFLKNGQIWKRGPAFMTWIFDEFYGRVVYGIMTLPTMLYFSLLMTQYPWKRLAEFDVLHPTKFSYMEYFLALGATLPGGLIGSIIVFLTPKNPLAKKLKIFAFWAYSWLFCIFLFNFIPQQSPTRFSQVLPHVPLGILMVYGVLAIGSALVRIIKKQKGHLTEQKRMIIKTLTGLHLTILVLPVIVITLGCGTMFSSWMWEKDFIDHKLRADYPLVPKGAEVMYPLKDLVDAFTWLEVNTPRSAVVISGKATGNMIPVYSGNTTFIGHANTVDSETKEIAVANFYGRKRPIQDFVDYFRKYNIQYVVYGPEEAELAFGAFDLTQYYPFLRQTYKNSMVTVYQVNLPQQ
jgi:hypothetical protein